jgi:7-carboxy-7-deazaguanine synthase
LFVTEDSTRIRISEIFETVQGEGPRVGTPTTFVRTAGCNFRCPGWGVRTRLPSGEEVVGCDSPHSVFPELYNQPGGSHWLSPDQLLERVPKWPTNICLTGGEPLLQWKSLSTVVDGWLHRGHTVEIFTNGSLRAPTGRVWLAMERKPSKDKLTYVMDHKLPSSGEHGKFNPDNFEQLTVNDCVKFVIQDWNDFEVATDTIESRRKEFAGTWLMGVVWGKLDPKELISWILADGRTGRRNVRLNLQTQSMLGMDELERTAYAKHV